MAGNGRRQEAMFLSDSDFEFGNDEESESKYKEGMPKKSGRKLAQEVANLRKTSATKPNSMTALKTRKENQKVEHKNNR
ncbi:hypothetical protein SUGI_0556520 [Cryptomeria japonica]|nr:hypothetical protein SUGI_0556520 [Cryptomeria japonica]